MTPPLSPSIRPSVVLSTRSLLFLPSDGGRGREDGKGTDVFSPSLRKIPHSDVGCCFSARHKDLLHCLTSVGFQTHCLWQLGPSPTQLLIYTVSHCLFMKPFDTLWAVQATLYLKALTLFLFLTLDVPLFSSQCGAFLRRPKFVSGLLKRHHL